MIEIKSGRTLGLSILFCLLAALLAACGDNTVTPGPSIVFITTGAATTVAGSDTITGTNTGSTTPTVAASPTAATSITSGKLVYDTADGQIMLINGNSAATKIASGSSPIFSPDGTRVAFMVTEGKALGNPPLQATISSVTLDGKDQQNYCKAKAGQEAALISWSTKGKFIAFESGIPNTDPPNPVYLCTVDTKTAATSAIKVTQGTVMQTYDWTPDGQSALWEAGKSSMDVFFGDPDQGGKGAVNVSNGLNQASVAGNTKLYNQVLVSPDNLTIALVGSKVFMVSVPGAKSPYEGKSLDGITNPVSVAWSPDNKMLAVIDDTGTSGTLKLVDLASGTVSKIADNVGVMVDWTK